MANVASAASSTSWRYGYVVAPHSAAIAPPMARQLLLTLVVLSVTVFSRFGINLGTYSLSFSLIAIYGLVAVTLAVRGSGNRSAPILGLLRLHRCGNRQLRPQHELLVRRPLLMDLLALAGSDLLSARVRVMDQGKRRTSGAMDNADVLQCCAVLRLCRYRSVLRAVRYS